MKKAQQKKDLAPRSAKSLILFGAMYGARTHDPWNHNPLLYQLS